ncbi:MAG TPA: HAD hydrolase family protein [Candidatus Saccharimonadales bacterium]|nr:HAD hydrolase family protein [Candidatus Saccharimonadales bacterium]
MFDVHVTHKHGTKAYAMQEWRALVGVSREECVGLGDSANDLPLFEAVGLKVTVGNATDDLKTNADYMAPPRGEGALRHVLNTFFLGRASGADM